MTKELYTRLGLSETASTNEIEEAYKALSAGYSPDNGHTDDSSRARYESLTEAYSVLSDLSSRAEYDIRGKIRQKGKKGSGKAVQTTTIYKAREIINRIFLCGAAISAILFVIYKTGGSPIPFLCVCGLSLALKIAEYIMRLIQ